MIKYDLSKAYPRLKDKFLRYNIVGHVYKDEKGNQYLFLGQGRRVWWYSEENNKRLWLYMRINMINKYIPKEYNFNIYDIFNNICKNTNSEINAHICVREKPLKFVKDCGKLYNYKDEDYIKKYDIKYYSKYREQYNTTIVDLRFNKDNVINEIDNCNICNNLSKINRLTKEEKEIIKQKELNYKKEKLQNCFLEEIKNIIEYWNSVNESSKDKTNGVAHSILSLIDGCDGNCNGYSLIPYEENIDISGDLNDKLFNKYIKNS